ncbi:MAG: hypothetical protein WCK86_02970 [Planctomycetia bacterium]
MFSGRTKQSLLAAVLAVSSIVSSVYAQSEGSPRVNSSQILPKDTYLYLSMPSVAALKEQMSKSSMGRMFTDPAMDDFRAELMTVLAEQMQDRASAVQDALGMTMDDLMSIPSGEITLAFSKAPPNRMGAVVFFEYGEHESQMKSILDKAVTGLNSSPVLESANMEHAGTEIVLYKNTSDTANATPLAKEFGWFLKDQKMVASNSSALLKLALDNWDGTSQKTLTSNETYSYIMGKCETKPGAGVMTMFFDPIGLFTQLVQTGSLGEAGLQAGMAMSVLPMLGLNQMKGMGTVMEMNTDSYDALSQSMIYCEQPPMFMMQMFQLDTVEQAPPAWVKENVTTWMATKWKVDEAWKTAESMVDMFQGPGALARLVDEAAERDPQIHVKNDIIDQLDGRMQFSTAGDGSETSTGANDILIAIGVRDTAKITELLTKMASQPGFSAEQREMEGVTVYELPLGPDGSKLAFTAANNQLLIGVGGAQLEMAVRNTSDVRPLSETAQFQAVAAQFPEDARMVSFSRPADTYRGLYEMLRKGDAADAFPGADEFLGMVDFTKLPAFESIEKYFAPAGGYWVSDENGVMMKNFSLPVEK